MKEKDYQSVYDYYMHLAKLIVGEGTSKLEAFYEDGDVSLFVCYRTILAEADLSQEDETELRKIDQKIAELFTPELLEEYEIYDSGARKWWGAKSNRTT